MSLPRPTVTLAVVVLLGVPLVVAPFAVPAPNLDRTYEAVAVDPETDATVVAHRVDEVTNLTALADTPASRDAVARAADGATVTVRDRESPLARPFDDREYAVFGDRYYRVVTRPVGGESAATNTTDTTDTASTRTPNATGFEPLTLRLRPVDGETVVSSLATPYADTRPAVQRVVDEGEATITPPDGDGLARVFAPPGVPSVIVRDGTYYAVSEVNPLATVGRFAGFYLRAAILPAFQRLGVTYVGVAAGTYALAVRRGRRDSLTDRGGLGVVAGVFGLQVAVSALGSSVSAAGGLLAGLPAGVAGAVAQVAFGGLTAASTLPVAATLLVGVAWRRHGLGRRVGLAVGGVAAALTAHAALTGAVAGSAFPAVFALLVGRAGRRGGVRSRGWGGRARGPVTVLKSHYVFASYQLGSKHLRKVIYISSE